MASEGVEEIECVKLLREVSGYWGAFLDAKNELDRGYHHTGWRSPYHMGLTPGPLLDAAARKLHELLPAAITYTAKLEGLDVPVSIRIEIQEQLYRVLQEIAVLIRRGGGFVQGEGRDLDQILDDILARLAVLPPKAASTEAQIPKADVRPDAPATDAVIGAPALLSTHTATVRGENAKSANAITDANPPEEKERVNRETLQPSGDQVAENKLKSEPVLHSGAAIMGSEHEPDATGEVKSPSDGGRTLELFLSIADVLDLTGVSDQTLNKYARLARVPTPSVGKRNHRYTINDVKAILRKLMGSDNRKQRNRAGEVLKDLETSEGLETSERLKTLDRLKDRWREADKSSSD